MSHDENHLNAISLVTHSDEALWEWDVPNDALYWSRGARQILRMDEPPAKMASFYELLPPDAADELMTVRNRALSSHDISSLEYDYVCNGVWIHEILLIMARDQAGIATRALGSIKARPMIKGIGFYQESGRLADVGAWVYEVPSGRIWRDKTCRIILGQEKEGFSVVSSEEPLLTVHPSEQKTIQRHYQLFCESPFLGDYITDIVHIRNGQGVYVPVLVRASAVERDEEGKALLVAGIIASNDSLSRGTTNKDKIFQALSSMGSGHWTWDTYAPAIHIDGAFMEVLGYQSGGAFRIDLVHPDDQEKLRKARESVIEDKGSDAYECTYRLQRADGGWAWMFERGCVSWRDQNGRAGQLFGSLTNITTAQEERHKLEELVRIDSLTGVNSRAYCMLELERLERKGMRPVSIISLDITGLKMINDSLGHAGGDALLTRAATILKGCLRQSDFIARTGGDEFLVVLAGQSLRTGEKVMAKIRRAFDAANADDTEMPVFVASGVACADNPEAPIAETIARADERMYENKNAAKAMNRARLAAWIRKATGREPPRDDRV